MNVHKTLRRCPGRLLDVLCTFNLRPVSTLCELGGSWVSNSKDDKHVDQISYIGAITIITFAYSKKRKKRTVLK